MSPVVRVLAPGPPGHGVVRHAAQVADATRRCGAVPVRSGPADLTHAQFTDALWGPDVATAAAAFARAARDVPRPLVVTLHDVPGGDQDRARDARRAAGYRHVVACADAVVVSSGHEAAKVRATTGADPDVLALPLPPVAPAGPAPPWAGEPTVGVLGFVYPGKGHAEAIAAAAAVPGPERPAVVAAGAAAPDHRGLPGALAAAAAAAGVGWHHTGGLDGAGLAAAAAAVTVPLAPNRTVSASGSLLAWLAHGRVPVTASGPFAAEVAARAPGSVTLHHDDAHRDALVAAALDAPGRTRGPVPDWPDPGPGHLALYRRLTGTVR